MLTRKNYAAIAAIILYEAKKGNGEPTYQDKNGTFRLVSSGEILQPYWGTMRTSTLASALGHYFSEDNPNFDWDKFSDACGYHARGPIERHHKNCENCIDEALESWEQLEMEGVDT
jgi:hypothetical protein